MISFCLQNRGIAAVYFSVGLANSVPRFVVLRFYLIIKPSSSQKTSFPALGFFGDSCLENPVCHFVIVHVFNLDLYVCRLLMYLLQC